MPEIEGSIIVALTSVTTESEKRERDHALGQNIRFRTYVTFRVEARQPSWLPQRKGQSAGAACSAQSDVRPIATAG
jgi:hypothetical protein